jgi:hypothetical protein
MMRKFLYLSISAMALFLASCQKETINPTQVVSNKNGNVEVFATTKVIDNSTTVTAVDAQSVHFTGNSDLLNKLKAGDVLVAPVLPNAPEGFLRRVERISHQGNVWTVTTTQAALTDAIKNANIHIEHTIQAPAPNAQGTASNRANPFTLPLNYVLFDADGNSSTVYDQVRMNGSAVFTPSLDLDLQIGSGQVDYFNLGANFQTVINEQFSAGGTIPFSVSREIYNQNLSAITFWIGWFPIVITPNVAVKVGANGQVTATVSATYTNTTTIGAYLRYQNSTWTKGFSRSMANSFIYNGASVNASAKGWVEPRLTAKLYGFDGARASVFAQAYLLINGSLAPTATCSLKAGITAGGDASLSILSWNIASCNYPDIFQYQTTLYTCN